MSACDNLGWWKGFLDSLDSGGGHIFVLFVLILVGAWMFVAHDATAGGQIITLSFGALLALTKTVASNREQMGTTTTSAATTTTTPSPDPPPPAPTVVS